MPTLREVSIIAAIYQSLVARLDQRLDDGEDLGSLKEWITRQNKWRAARHGLDAEIIVDDSGDRGGRSGVRSRAAARGARAHGRRAPVSRR